MICRRTTYIATFARLGIYETTSRFIFDVIARRLVQDPSNRDALVELMAGLPSK
jgi:hypothetical protein